MRLNIKYQNNRSSEFNQSTFSTATIGRSYDSRLINNF